MYKARFKQWACHKNVRRGELLSINRTLSKRGSISKATDVTKRRSVGEVTIGEWRRYLGKSPGMDLDSNDGAHLSNPGYVTGALY